MCHTPGIVYTLWYHHRMALTKADLQAVGSVVGSQLDQRVGTLIEQQVRPIVKEEIRAAIATQTKLIEQGFADLKAVMKTRMSTGKNLKNATPNSKTKWMT
jgi:hypothetical protein